MLVWPTFLLVDNANPCHPSQPLEPSSSPSSLTNASPQPLHSPLPHIDLLDSHLFSPTLHTPSSIYSLLHMGRLYCHFVESHLQCPHPAQFQFSYSHLPLSHLPYSDPLYSRTHNHTLTEDVKFPPTNF